MADSKIDGLAELPSASLASTDWLAVFDTSTGTTKKLAPSDLLGLVTGTFAGGDILYHNGTSFVKLAKGTAEQVLAMNTGATAPEWIDLSADPNGTVLATATISNDTTVDFTSFRDDATYRHYRIVLERVVPASDDVQLSMLTSTDGGASWGSNYNTDLNGYGPSSGDSTGGVSQSEIALAGGGTFSPVGSAAGEVGVDGEINMFFADIADRTQFDGKTRWINAGSDVEMAEVWAERASNEDTDALRFSFSSGNLESGTIKIYGVV